MLLFIYQVSWRAANTDDLQRQMKCYVTFYSHAVLLMSFHGWNTERLHEAWDVQTCLFTLKLVVQKKEWSCWSFMISAQACGASRLRHGNRSWSQPLESMRVGFIPARFRTAPEAVLRGVDTAICHAISKTVKTPLIIWISPPKNVFDSHEYLYRYTPSRY